MCYTKYHPYFNLIFKSITEYFYFMTARTNSSRDVPIYFYFEPFCYHSGECMSQRFLILCGASWHLVTEPDIVTPDPDIGNRRVKVKVVSSRARTSPGLNPSQGKKTVMLSAESCGEMQCFLPHDNASFSSVVCSFSDWFLTQQPAISCNGNNRHI